MSRVISQSSLTVKDFDDADMAGAELRLKVRDNEEGQEDGPGDRLFALSLHRADNGKNLKKRESHGV